MLFIFNPNADMRICETSLYDILFQYWVPMDKFTVLNLSVCRPAFNDHSNPTKSVSLPCNARLYLTTLAMGTPYFYI